MALTVNRLGMSLMRMGNSTDSVRFLDDVDLTFSLDSRSSSMQQMASIEISAKPIIFRASYRDINMITSIVNKAITLYGQKSNPTSDATTLSKYSATTFPTSQVSKSNTSKALPYPAGNARVLMSKEQVGLAIYHLYLD